MQIKLLWHIIIFLSLSEKQTGINQQPKNQCFWLAVPNPQFQILAIKYCSVKNLQVTFKQGIIIFHWQITSQNIFGLFLNNAIELTVWVNHALGENV